MTANTVTAHREETIRLMEARNCQSNTLIEQAKELLRQATDVDLCNIATEILFAYPAAHTIELIEDQRTGYEGVVFCGHIDDENGKKIADSFNAKEFVEKTVAEYKLADPKSAINRFINLREYAAKKPNWFKGVADNGSTSFNP